MGKWSTVNTERSRRGSDHEGEDAERALRTSEERLRAIIETLPVMVFTLDRDGVITFTDGAGLEPLGLVPGENVGRNALELYAHVPAVADGVARVLSGESVTNEVEFGGQILSSTFHPTFGADGAVDGAVGVSVIVTGERLVQRELERRLAQQAAVVELGHLSLRSGSLQDFLRDVPGIVAPVLDSAFCIVGRVDGDRIVAVASLPPEIEGESIPRSDTATGLAVRTGEPVAITDIVQDDRFTLPLRGAERGLHAVAVAPVFVDGAVWGSLSISMERPHDFPVHDVTFLQAAANVVGAAVERDQRDLLRDRLHQQERLSSVGHLAAGIAHDFNNIMSVISLYAELTVREPGLEERVAERVSSIHLQAQRAIALVAQIMDFARPGAVDAVAVDLGDLVRGSLPALEQVAGPDVGIVVDVEPGDHVIEGDPARLQQVLRNVVANARDALDPGGVVRITVRDASTGTRMPPGESAGAWHRLAVTDAGIGIAPEVLGRVFEPFFSTKSASGGAGLGLSQVHGLVRAHGGEIEIDSTPGEGTTVSMWFPASSEASAADPRLVISGAERGSGAPILVVDDDNAVRAAMADLLEELGYSTRSAASGEDAVAVLERESVGAVVTDLNMPGMDGRELAERIRIGWPDIPVVIVTGSIIDRAAIDAGNSGDGPIWMQKPFTAEQIAVTLAALIDE